MSSSRRAFIIIFCRSQITGSTFKRQWLQNQSKPVFAAQAEKCDFVIPTQTKWNIRPQDPLQLIVLLESNGLEQTLHEVHDSILVVFPKFIWNGVTPLVILYLSPPQIVWWLELVVSCVQYSEQSIVATSFQFFLADGASGKKNRASNSDINKKILDIKSRNITYAAISRAVTRWTHKYKT